MNGWPTIEQDFRRTIKAFVFCTIKASAKTIDQYYEARKPRDR